MIPGQLAGASIPTCPDHIAAFSAMGLGLVITLTEEQQLPVEWFKGSGVENMFVPVVNYQPPSVEQMDEMMGAMEAVVAR